jgi:hypothetical protein
MHLGAGRLQGRRCAQAHCIPAIFILSALVIAGYQQHWAMTPRREKCKQSHLTLIVDSRKVSSLRSEFR